MYSKNALSDQNTISTDFMIRFLCGTAFGKILIKNQKEENSSLQKQFSLSRILAKNF